MIEMPAISSYPLITKARMNSIAPLGLFIASNLSTDTFGKLRPDDYTAIKKFTKDCIANPKILLDLKNPDFEPFLKTLPKMISPILYMGSAIASVYNNEKSKISHDQLRESVRHIEEILTTVNDLPK
jgi:hypothetical protein